MPSVQAPPVQIQDGQIRTVTKTSAMAAPKEDCQPPLVTDNINPNLVAAQYAVRGEIVIRADEIKQQLRQGAKFPFDKMVFCNVGNPQQLGQKPITFARQMAALCDYPQLAETMPEAFPSDIVEKSKRILSEIGSTGAYSESKGALVLREMVCQGIMDRDGFPSEPQNIYMTNGASPAVHGLLNLMIRDSNDGMLVPIPQYPLYSAGLKMAGGALVPYYLDEESGWSLNPHNLQKSLDLAKEKGIQTRALVVINPGNPTGQCLSRENQQDVISFCVENGLVLIADEVYQTNVYAETKQFNSFKKVYMEMGTAAASLQLASLHSISKGMFGECGRRGGYMEVCGFSSEAHAQLLKGWAVNLCPNLSGQIIMANQMQPPRAGEPSHELYRTETQKIYNSLKRRAKMLAGALNKLEGVSCQEAEGAMYCFPKISLPQLAIAKATSLGKQADFMYCMECLEKTGIVIVPGSGFKQVDGTFHFRTTFLPQEQDLLSVVERLGEFHQDFLRRYTQ